MGKFISGLIVGLIIAGIVGFVVYPGLKEKSIEEGSSEGYSKGMTEGIKKGMEDYAAQIEAREQHVKDSTDHAIKLIEDQRRAAARRQAKKVKPVQNWHVINGQIEEPISDQ